MGNTRTDIIDLAEQLIRSKGFNAFSYADISGPLGIKNAAVHYHFPSKAALGTAVINRTREAFEANTLEWGKQTPPQQLNAFIGIYTSSQQKDLVCFMGALGPAYDTLPQPMQEALTEASEEIRSWLRNVLSTGLEAGDFHFTETVEARADLIIGSLLSSLILHRVTKDDVPANVRAAVLSGLSNT